MNDHFWDYGGMKLDHFVLEKARAKKSLKSKNVLCFCYHRLPYVSAQFWRKLNSTQQCKISKLLYSTLAFHWYKHIIITKRLTTIDYDLIHDEGILLGIKIYIISRLFSWPCLRYHSSHMNTFLHHNAMGWNSL